MSEYADITVNNLTLCCFRNYLDEKIVSSFFTKEDLIITPNCKLDDEDDDSLYTDYLYKTTVKKAKERFDARGYSINNLEMEFNSKMFQAIDYSAFLYHKEINFDDDSKYDERIKKNVTFKKWKNAMNKIISYELENGNIMWMYDVVPDIRINSECEKVIYYTLQDDNQESFYGLNLDIIEIDYIFRLILESCNENDEIYLNFSNLVYWSDDCIPKALSATGKHKKTIVLVEGTSDKDILEFSIKKIYPNLSDLFYFMDFEDASGGKRDGGTSFVVKNLKTFYFSKIDAKFIAIFDNDAEGYQSKNVLLNDIKAWPSNFRILLYPEIKAFHSYPTLSPNGKVLKDNINKKACSIELYLPDNLIKKDEEYYPIEWESRKKIKETNGKEISLYQGVISQKKDINNNFHKLCNAIENGEKTFEIEQWNRMKQLLDTLVFAFVKNQV